MSDDKKPRLRNSRDRHAALMRRAERQLEQRRKDDELIERAMERVKEQRPNWIKR